MIKKEVEFLPWSWDKIIQRLGLVHYVTIFKMIYYIPKTNTCSPSYDPSKVPCSFKAINLHQIGSHTKTLFPRALALDITIEAKTLFPRASALDIIIEAKPQVF